MERFVYVQQGENFEKRNVKVGVSDFFFAEIQEGLSPGDVVSLELPKEEREKKARQLVGQRPGGGSESLAMKSTPTAVAAMTNSAASSSTNKSSESSPKNRSGEGKRRGATDTSTSSSH